MSSKPLDTETRRRGDAETKNPRSKASLERSHEWLSYFKDERTTLHMMHPAMSVIIACINTSFEDGKFRVVIKSSRKGFSISLNGSVICKGKDLVEFAESWKAQQQAAMEKAAAKEHLNLEEVKA